MTGFRFYYQCGGAILPDNPTFIIRETDDILYEYLKQGELCYVFNSRQTGKSTTANSVMEKLRSDEIKYVYIDVTELITKNEKSLYYEKQKSEEDIYDIFFKGVTEKIWAKLKLPEEYYIQWESKYSDRQSSPRKKFQDFIDQILLPNITDKFIFFLDEIDWLFDVKSLVDDLFTLIRVFYNQRQKYNGLVFCFLGVATPDELINSSTTTPFNIGESIELSGFKFEQVKKPLGRGLTETVDDPDAILQEILKWTNGQPFLTQRLCSIVVKNSESRNPDIRQLVQENLIINSDKPANKTHFTYIRKRFLEHNPDQLRTRLNLYKEILQSKDGTNSNDSPAEIELRLTGIVKKEVNQLKVLNPIYEQVFNVDWVESELNQLSVKKEVKKTLILLIKTFKNKILEQGRLWKASYMGINTSFLQFVLLNIELPLATLFSTLSIPEICLILFLALMLFKQFKLKILEFCIFSNILLLLLVFFARNLIVEYSIFTRGLLAFVFALVLLTSNIFTQSKNH